MATGAATGSRPPNERHVVMMTCTACTPGRAPVDADNPAGARDATSAARSICWMIRKLSLRTAHPALVPRCVRAKATQEISAFVV